MRYPHDEPRIASWIEDGFDVIVAGMAPEEWDPATDESDAGAADTSATSDPTAADENSTHSTPDRDAPPEIPRERAQQLLLDYYEAESDAEYALEELLEHGWFYEVDGRLRVTEPEW